MDKIYRDILDKIFTQADILFGDINLLKGIILGEECMSKRNKNGIKMSKYDWVWRSLVARLNGVQF